MACVQHSLQTVLTNWGTNMVACMWPPTERGLLCPYAMSKAVLRMLRVLKEDITTCLLACRQSQKSTAAARASNARSPCLQRVRKSTLSAPVAQLGTDSAVLPACRKRSRPC